MQHSDSDCFATEVWLFNEMTKATIEKQAASCPKGILVGGFNPFEKYESNWESSPGGGENKKYLKPPASIELWTFHWNAVHKKKHLQVRPVRYGSNYGLMVSENPARKPPGMYTPEN